MAGYLFITGVIFLYFGARALLKPVEAIAAPYSLGADNVDAKNFLRSGAGGVTVACAVVFIAAAFIQPLAFAALLMAIVIMGGLVFGRLVSLVVDGRPGLVPRMSLIGEGLGCMFGIYWLWQIGA